MRDKDEKVTQLPDNVNVETEASKDKTAGVNKKDETVITSKTSNTKQLPHNHDVVSEILASHPDSQARIQPFLAAKQTCL